MSRRLLACLSLGAVLTAGVALEPPPALAADSPPNDDLANNTVLLSAGGTVTGSNVGASAQPGEPNHAGATFEGEPLGAIHSVWWSWDATSTGEATISTCGSAFNTRLAVYTGDSMASLQQVAATLDGNDGSCDSRFAGVTFQATKDTIYRIAVDTEGGLNADGTGEPWGSIQLTVTPPPGEEEPPPPPPPGDDDTNPGVAATEKPVTVTVPRFKPICDQERSKSKADCPDDATGFKFYSAEPYQDWQGRYDSVRRWVDKQVEKRGADITYITKAIPAGQTYGTLRDYLFKKGSGGEVIVQNVAPGTEVETTSDEPLVLKIKYFDPAEDQKILNSTLKELEKAGDGRKNVKSPCEFIDTDAGNQAIFRKLGEVLGVGTLTQKRAGQILEDFGCDYEVTKYVDGPGFTTDVVLDVVGVDKKRDLIQLEVALPLRQDFLFVISEEPQFAGADILGLGADGKLTASSTQLNRITVQVIERTTGRLVPGVSLDFWDTEGKPVTERTNDKGEWTFTSRMPVAGSYVLKATYSSNGAQMVGFRQVDVVDRKADYVTMSGRTMSWSGNGYRGTQADIDRAKSLDLVPANLGTGLIGAPTAPPTVEQITAAAPTADGLVVGQHNGVSIPDDTNFAVGSRSGLVVIGGGLPQQAATQRHAARPAVVQSLWPSWGDVAGMVSVILTGLQRALEQGPSAPGRVEKVLTSADQGHVTTAYDAYRSQGIPGPTSGLISDKGLGVISTGGGNVISTGGGNVISTGGLNLIGQAGGNVIATGGGNLIPVYGGNVIATGGGN